MNYVAFDLEIATVVPEDVQDWADYMPLGISCAATLRSGEETVRLWHGGLEDKQLGFDDLSDEPEQKYAQRMQPGQCDKLLAYLGECYEAGYSIVTWNGAGFDFWVLAEECSPACRQDIIRLADEHIDIAFHMLCVKGYMISLDSAAKGLRVGTKTEGMYGAMAPVMWQQGRAEQEKVLEYVAQDVRVTAAVFEAIQERGVLPWISRAGRPNVWSVGKKGLLPVVEAQLLPLPDTGWMTNPRSRESYLEWTYRTPDGAAGENRMVSLQSGGVGG